MAVRAKFNVTNVSKNQLTKTTDQNGNPWEYHQTNVSLAPVYVDNDQRKAGNTENEVFGRYTPNGKIELTIKNDAAAEQFAVDQEFYVDFTPAAVPVEA